MFVTMEHVLVTCSAGLTKLTTFFRVLEAWCHCDFRKMEALQVNKFGRTCRTGAQVAQVIVVRSYYFLYLYKNVQLAKRDIVTAVIYYYITTKFHYVKDDSRLLVVGTEVSYFCYICYKISKFRLKYLLTFFPIHNTSIR